MTTTLAEPENLTMEDLLREHEVRALAHGDIVDGVVVRVDPDEVLVDIGGKSEGIISNRELVARGEQPVELSAGDEVKVYVIQPENEQGNVVLSLRKARAEGIWQKVAEKETEGEIIDAEVREQNKGGLIVNILGLRGFLPSSQVARQFSGNLMELVGQKIPVKILEVNRKRNRLIVSQRAAQDEDRARQREELFEKLQVGDVVEGKVSGLTSYGAFVNLGGADGLIHISELSWDRINNVSDMLAVGDDVKVKVIKLDPELSRISLSLRQMSEDPWDTIEDRFPAGKVVEGEVTKTKKYGAFLQIADGVEGLLHISELSWDHVERTEDVLRVGERIQVVVLNADKVRRRISLSLRQLHGRGDGEGGGPAPASASDWQQPERREEPMTAMGSAFADAYGERDEQEAGSREDGQGLLGSAAETATNVASTVASTVSEAVSSVAERVTSVFGGGDEEAASTGSAAPAEDEDGGGEAGTGGAHEDPAAPQHNPARGEDAEENTPVE